MRKIAEQKKISKVADATRNDRDSNYELIHLPGSIQPHGVLIVFKEPDLEIIQVSKNTKEYLGIEAEKLLDKSLDFLLEKEAIKSLRDCLLSADLETIESLKITQKETQQERYFIGRIHKSKKNLILEIEPKTSQKEVSFSSIYKTIKKTIIKIKKARELDELLGAAVKEIKKITQFDRVMIYKFDRDGAGEVIAEAKETELPAYLGLHYPAADIPEAAKALYKSNPIRFIPDMNYRAVPLLPQENPFTKKPLDLSLSILRSVHNCCIEYHQNINAKALLVIPLTKKENLWGLISCHHQTAKYLPYEIRAAIEFIGHIVALELVDRYSKKELKYIIKLRSLRSEIFQSIAKVDNLKQALIDPKLPLLDLVGASGAAVCLSDEINLIGKTPTKEQITRTIAALDSSIADSLFSSNSLAKFYPAAEAFKDRASGLLMLRISRIRRYYILWFRPEIIQTINWAGNPYPGETDSLALSPRKSFSKWVETVKLTSLPWLECELENALNLQSAIVGIVLKKADELAETVEELKQRNQELDFFAYAASHDLKEPLRGIYNYSTFLLEDYGEILDEKGKKKLETLIRLSDRTTTLIDTLFNFSRLGKAQLKLESIDINLLLQEILEMFRASNQGRDFQIRIPRPLPTIECDRILIEEVFTNLIANAFKYNDKSAKCLEIGYLEDPLTEYIFYFKDNGIGIRDRHLDTIFRLFKRLHSQRKYGGGTGAGLTIAKKIVERHGGKIWVQSTYGRGSTFYLTLKPR